MRFTTENTENTEKEWVGTITEKQFGYTVIYPHLIEGILLWASPGL